MNQCSRVSGLCFGNDGFSLIELVITIVILGFTLTLLVPFFQAIEHSSDPIVRERTVALGQSIMDEVLSRRWDENTRVGGGPICSGESGGGGRGLSSYGAPLSCPHASLNASGALSPDGGENRQSYDDLDDYNSLVEADNFLDQAGVGFTYSGYSRSVAIDYILSNSASVTAVTASAGTTTDTKRVRVTVTNPLGEQFVFVALACNL